MSLYRLVTLAEVKRNSRYTGTANDVELLEIIDDASQFVMNYLDGAATLSGWTDSNGIPLVDSNGDPLIIDYLTDSNGDPLTDSNGDYVGGHTIIPGSVRRATLLVVASLDTNREGTVDPITPAVRNLLVRYRDPTVA